MPAVLVPRRMLAKGTLPAICLVTGERNVPIKKVTLHERMGPWFLIALSMPLLAPFFLAPVRARLPLSRRAAWGMLATQMLMFPVAIVVLWVLCIGIPVLTKSIWLTLLALPAGALLVHRAMSRAQDSFLPYYEDVGDHVARLHIPSTAAAGAIRTAVAQRMLPEDIVEELTALGEHLPSLTRH